MAQEVELINPLLLQLYDLKAKPPPQPVSALALSIFNWGVEDTASAITSGSPFGRRLEGGEATILLDSVGIEQNRRHSGGALHPRSRSILTRLASCGLCLLSSMATTVHQDEIVSRNPKIAGPQVVWEVILRHVRFPVCGIFHRPTCMGCEKALTHKRRESPFGS